MSEVVDIWHNGAAAFGSYRNPLWRIFRFLPLRCDSVDLLEGSSLSDPALVEAFFAGYHITGPVEKPVIGLSNCS